MATITTTELENVECWCGAPMALPKNLLRNARENGHVLHCPATGHTFGWDGEIDRLRKKLKQEQARAVALDDQLLASERSRKELHTQLTKIRKRAQGGVCPCCNRSFVQLARHMANKHPDFEAGAK